MSEPEPCTCGRALLSYVTDHHLRQVLHQKGIIDVTLPFGTVLPHDCREESDA